MEVKAVASPRWDHVLVAAAGRYKALRKIADGGTAEVFLGEHVGSAGFRRLVVLKRIHAAVAQRPELARLLVEEAHVASHLHHGNLVEVRDLGQAHGRHFLVLERVDGWSFAQLLERAKAAKVPVPARVALHVAAEVCRGLQHAHEHGVVHCDVCPHNILVAETGEVKLTDFGIARMPARPGPKGLVAGKPSYMSPEQARGESLDARSDLFSLGTVLYLALTGTLPFKGRDDGQLLERVAKGDFASPMKGNPSLPKELGQLLIAAMRPEPWARYQTAHELLAAMELVLRAGARTELERWLAVLHEADHAVPPTREKGAAVVHLKVVRTAPTKPAVRRRPGRWVMATAAAVTVVAALGAVHPWREWGHVAAEAAPAGPVMTPPPLVQAVLDVGRDEPEVNVELPALELSGRVTGLYDQDRAMVQLDTEPEGAEVIIDGRVYGVTPVTLRFRTGIPFEVAFVRTGNAPLTRWLTVERPKTGPVRVTFSDPLPKKAKR